MGTKRTDEFRKDAVRIAMTHLADSAKAGLASGRMLSWHQT
jgi:hypothetical protein